MSGWDDPAGRIRELEAEKASLRHLLDQLAATREADSRAVSERHFGGGK